MGMDCAAQRGSQQNSLWALSGRSKNQNKHKKKITIDMETRIQFNDF